METLIENIWFILVGGMVIIFGIIWVKLSQEHCFSGLSNQYIRGRKQYVNAFTALHNLQDASFEQWHGFLLRTEGTGDWEPVVLAIQGMYQTARSEKEKRYLFDIVCKQPDPFWGSRAVQLVGIPSKKIIMDFCS